MSKHILVTGGTGYVGTHVVAQLLEQRHQFCVAVRSQSSAEKVMKSHAIHKDNLTTVIVPNITVKGAFDAAVKSSTRATSIRRKTGTPSRTRRRKTVAGVQGTSGPRCWQRRPHGRLLMTRTAMRLQFLGRVRGPPRSSTSRCCVHPPSTGPRRTTSATCRRSAPAWQTFNAT